MILGLSFLSTYYFEKLITIIINPSNFLLLIAYAIVTFLFILILSLALFCIKKNFRKQFAGTLKMILSSITKRKSIKTN